MRLKRVNRYDCEFCTKANCSASGVRPSQAAGATRR